MVTELRVHGVVMRSAQVYEILCRASLDRSHIRVIPRTARTRSSDVGNLARRFWAIAIDLRIDS
ncbi:hypothetical protein JF66_19640 [Cryobacterium sp. MLB-32]|nr:hypothetical protein JF66_19640 [Cryobacterium sp. MLB-32]